MIWFALRGMHLRHKRVLMDRKSRLCHTFHHPIEFILHPRGIRAQQTCVDNITPWPRSLPEPSNAFAQPYSPTVPQSSSAPAQSHSPTAPGGGSTGRRMRSSPEAASGPNLVAKGTGLRSPWAPKAPGGPWAEGKFCPWLPFATSLLSAMYPST